MTDPTRTIRAATAGDIPQILRLVRELATYEREPESVVATEEMYATALFPADGHPAAYADLAFTGPDVAGMALWFPSFSTWTGRPGIWLEDLIVAAGHRGGGIGLALMRHLAGRCAERGWTRLDWSVLTWNAPAIGFYESLGAHRTSDWVGYRLDAAALSRLTLRS